MIASSQVGSDRYYPTFETGSMKLDCPFIGLFHEVHRTLRIYGETNSAYCFACKDYFTPVKLISMSKDMTSDEATQWILKEKNYTEPTFEEMWDAMEAEEELVDTHSLAEALKTACAAMDPRWKDKQFEESVSGKLQQCFVLLSKVKTASDSELWLKASKVAMARVLEQAP